MKSIGKILILMAAIGLSFSAGAYEAASREILGKVVAEKRTFRVSVEQCLANFKKGAFSSHCSVSDAGLSALPGDIKIPGGTSDFAIEEAGDQHHSASASIRFHASGWVVEFVRSSDGGGMKAMDAAGARAYMEKIVRKLKGDAVVLVYTVAKPGSTFK